MSMHLIWRKLWTPQFYLTPLGGYVSTIFLYLLYLALFTAMTWEEFGVYDEIEPDQAVFIIFNLGYIVCICSSSAI